MTSQFLITPSPDLVEQWANDSVPRRANATGVDWEIAFAMRAVQWGADQELEACCEWMSAQGYHCGSERMRNDRRPKQSSLKKQAIALINSCTDPDGDYLDDNALTTIRRALEQLPDEQ